MQNEDDEVFQLRQSGTHSPGLLEGRWGSGRKKTRRCCGPRPRRGGVAGRGRGSGESHSDQPGSGDSKQVSFAVRDNSSSDINFDNYATVTMEKVYGTGPK